MCKQIYPPPPSLLVTPQTISKGHKLSFYEVLEISNKIQVQIKCCEPANNRTITKLTNFCEENVRIMRKGYVEEQY